MNASIALATIALIAGVAALALAGFLFVRPRTLRWGATAAEADQALVGDDLIPDPILVTTRALTIHATPEQVWPWLAQMGQGRGGFYSYEWLENLFGLDIHNSDRIMPEFQDLKLGDLIPFWRGAGVSVVKVEPNRYLLLAGTLNPAKGTDGSAGAGGQVGGSWAFVLRKGNREATRLVVRSRVAKFEPTWLSTLFIRLLLEPAHFVMERGMLHGIRVRSQRLRPEGAASDSEP